ncbi:MAG: glycosyltransferase [Ardenticatenaceae bacterium]|nr:glycosyltransferase [Ardenticatenaceae bacterium]
MTTLPTFSIIVPTYDRPLPLWRCLQALTQLDYPRALFEVVVVDDGSRMLLAPLVAAFQAKMTIHLVTQRHKGPAAARNVGAGVANGRFLAFTDDDCAPHADWLYQLALCLLAHPDKMVGGRTQNALPQNWFSQTSQLLTNYLYGHYNSVADHARFLASNNFALAAERYRQVGGFDETLSLAAGEDREFCDRWRQHGLGMLYLPQAIVNHEHYLDVRSFWRQHFNYGRGAWLFHTIRSERTNRIIRLESLSFYLRLVSYPLLVGKGWRALRLTAMLVGTQAANAAGFFYERFASRHRAKKKLPQGELYRPIENISNTD